MFSLIALYISYRRNAATPAMITAAPVTVSAVNDRDALPTARAA